MSSSWFFPRMSQLERRRHSGRRRNVIAVVSQERTETKKEWISRVVNLIETINFLRSFRGSNGISIKLSMFCFCFSTWKRWSSRFCKRMLIFVGVCYLVAVRFAWEGGNKMNHSLSLFQKNLFLELSWEEYFIRRCLLVIEMTYKIEVAGYTVYIKR